MFKLDGNGKRLYTIYDDKISSVQGRNYTQVWCEEDTLSFQISWFDAPLDSSKTTTVRFYVNGTVRKTFTFNYGTTNVQGNLYTCFAVQKHTANSLSLNNGLFVFSQKIGAITDNHGERMLNEGDCFRITITSANGSVWESNHMEIVASGEGTKLIHYTNSSETNELVYNTYFGWMVYGYDIRLHGYYTDTSLASDMEMFETSQGGRIMITATPKWVTTLHLGLDGVGLPSYYTRLMNIVMCCDRKSINDFGEFEFFGDGFSLENFQTYSNEFYTADITTKDNKMYNDMDDGSGTFNMLAILEYETSQEVGYVVTVESNGNGNWYLSAPYAQAQSKLVGSDGMTTLYLKYIKSASDEPRTISVYKKNDNLLGSVTVNISAIMNSGLNFMAIGDTFLIK